MNDVYVNVSADKDPVKGQDFDTVGPNTFTVIMNGRERVATDSRFISFHNITYAVEQRVCFKKQLPKVILNDVRYGVWLLIRDAMLY